MAAFNENDGDTPKIPQRRVNRELGNAYSGNV